MLPCSQDGEYKMRNCPEKNFSCSHLFHRVIHRITRLIHSLPNSLTQFKKVFSIINKEIHTACAKKNITVFLVRNAEPQNGLLRDFADKTIFKDLLKCCLSKLYPKFTKVNNALKTASLLCFTGFFSNHKNVIAQNSPQLYIVEKKKILAKKLCQPCRV